MTYNNNDYNNDNSTKNLNPSDFDSISTASPQGPQSPQSMPSSPSGPEASSKELKVDETCSSSASGSLPTTSGQSDITKIKESMDKTLEKLEQNKDLVYPDTYDKWKSLLAQAKSGERNLDSYNKAKTAVTSNIADLKAKIYERDLLNSKESAFSDMFAEGEKAARKAESVLSAANKVSDYEKASHKGAIFAQKVMAKLADRESDEWRSKLIEYDKKLDYDFAQKSKQFLLENLDNFEFISNFFS